jgi:hypothetical protein
MPVFIVVVTKGLAGVGEQISKLPPNSTYSVKKDTWLIDYEGTTKEVAEMLGVRTGDASGIVFPISNYAGKHKRDIWEWLALHSAKE